MGGLPGITIYDSFGARLATAISLISLGLGLGSPAVVALPPGADFALDIFGSSYWVDLHICAS